MTITDDRIAGAILAAHRRGGAVRIVTDSNLPEMTAVVAESLALHRTIEAGWLELANRQLVVGEQVAVSCREYGVKLTITVPETPALREAAR